MFGLDPIGTSVISLEEGAEIILRLREPRGYIFSPGLIGQPGRLPQLRKHWEQV